MNKSKANYCTICDGTDYLKEFKSLYVCEHCVDEVKKHRLNDKKQSKEDI